MSTFIEYLISSLVLHLVFGNTVSFNSFYHLTKLQGEETAHIHLSVTFKCVIKVMLEQHQVNLEPNRTRPH